MTIRYERGVLVSPAIAKKWLGQNADNNRAVRNAKISQYAADMQAGFWQANTGETIKFDEHDVLIDGQNRLHAVIQAGVAVPFDIAHNVPSEAMRVLDTGAARTAADVLKIAGARERMRSASVVRWTIMWDHGHFIGSGNKLSPTTTDVITRYLAEPGAFDAATQRGSDVQKAGLGNGSAAGVGFYLFARLDVDQAHSFFDQLLTGADLPGRSPVLLLRNKLARVRVDRLTRAEQLAYLIKVWNFMRTDQDVERLHLVRGDLTNDNFPQPK